MKLKAKKAHKKPLPYRGEYNVRVLSHGEGWILVTHRAARARAYADAADILKTGLVMHGKRIKVAAVTVTPRWAETRPCDVSLVFEPPGADPQQEGL